ncbi:MAG: ABC transporter ATP-binding protein, partial [Ktedonobacterales bacterium]
MSQQFFQEDEILGKAYDARLVRRLWPFVRPYSRLLTTAVALMLSATLADLLNPFLTQRAIDLFIVPPRSSHLTLVQRANGVFLLALAYLAILCLGFGLRYFQYFLLSMIGQRVMYDLRSRMFGHLQSLSLSFFDHNPVGRLMTRITNDVDALNDLFTTGAITLLGDVFTIIAILFILLIENWKLALFVFLVLPPLAYATSYFQRAMRDNFRAIRVRLARINA